MLSEDRSETEFPSEELAARESREGSIPFARHKQKPELRWSVSFIAMVGYLFVEYMRLPAQYPIFRVIDIGKVVVVLALLGWIISPKLGSKGPGVAFIDAIILLFALLSLTSALFARYQHDAWQRFFDILRWLAIYFVVSRIIVSSWRQKVFVFFLLLLNLKMAQFAVRHFNALKSSGMSAANLVRNGVGAGSVGFFSNAGDFGVAMCVVLPLAGVLLLGTKKWIPRFFLLACFLTFTGAIIVCGSRGAVVGALAAALVVLARNPRRLGALFLFMFFIPGLIYFLPKETKERFEAALHWQTDATSRSRIQFWEAGLRMFHDHPILGVGPGNFPPNYAEKYSRPGDDPGLWVPHSIYIQALSELGAPGFLLFALLVFGCFRMNARTRKDLRERSPGKPKDFDYYLAMGLDAALVGYLVSGAFLAVLYYPHLWVLLGTSAGLNSAVAAKCAAEEGVRVSKAPVPSFDLASV